MPLPHLRDVTVGRLAGFLGGRTAASAAGIARRVALAVHRDNALSWDEIPIGRAARALCSSRFRFDPLLEPAGVLAGSDGASWKFTFRLGSSDPIEVVLIRHWDDHTLCLSTQVGCALGCTFCATGSMGLRRNLTAGEITEALVRVQRERGVRVTDVVFMGMGEPLHNYDAVMDACENLNHVWGHGISRKRITVSTAGLVPQIRRFTAERQRWRLHLSLHSALQETRERIMPIARVHPLPELLDAMREHQRALDVRWLTFQYVALPGVNTDQRHVDALRTELTDLQYILNVIPWNETSGPFRAPTWNEVREFTTRLRSVGCPVKVRYSAGKQDGMGCGQLAAETEAFAPASGHMVAPPGIFTA